MSENQNNELSILEIADELAPIETFEFELMNRVWKFKNQTSFSERKRFEEAGVNFAKNARLKNFQEEILEPLPETTSEEIEKKSKIRDFLKMRVIDDWTLAHQIAGLSVEPKITHLEAILLTRSSVFVATFTGNIYVHSSNAAKKKFVEAVEDSKKD